MSYDIMLYVLDKTHKISFFFFFFWFLRNKTLNNESNLIHFQRISNVSLTISSLFIRILFLEQCKENAKILNKDFIQNAFAIFLFYSPAMLKYYRVFQIINSLLFADCIERRHVTRIAGIS